LQLQVWRVLGFMYEQHYFTYLPRTSAWTDLRLFYLLGSTTSGAFLHPLSSVRYEVTGNAYKGADI